MRERKRRLPKMPRDIAIEVHKWDDGAAALIGKDELYGGRHPLERTHKTFENVLPLGYHIDGKRVYRVRRSNND